MKPIKKDILRLPWWLHCYDDNMPNLDPLCTGIYEISIANIRGIYLR
jgi:hypothetical protein